MRERKLNAYEKALLFVGVAILMIGYGLIHWQITKEGFTTDIIIAIFLWFILVIIIVIAAANENIKEELREVEEFQLQEIRLLREDIRRK